MKKLIYILLLTCTSCFVFAQQPDRSAPPKLAKAKNLQLPALQRFTLSNGLNVLLLEKHSVPLVQVNLLLQTGSYDDPAGKEGLSSFAMDLLDEGTQSLSALQFADEVEFLGASINTYSSGFTSGINCNTPVSKLEPSLKLMSDLIARPAFAETEIERIKKIRLTGLLQNYDEPTIIARRAYDKFIYDSSLPYGKFANEQSIQSFTKSDLLGFHKTYFTTGNSTLIIVGDITRQAALPLLEKYIAVLPAGTKTNVSRPVPAQTKGRTILLVDKPGAAQSVIRIGRIGVDRLTPDYNSIVVLNTILGGSFTSRLNNNLREVHGYAYGANSGFSFWPIPGPFTAASSVQTDVTGPALGEFFIEFKKIRTPLPDEDLERGKNYAALGYASNFETNGAIAAALAELVLYNLPESYFNTYVEKVLAVTKKDVEAAARKYITPEAMLVVIVGDRQKIEAGITKLNLGKITFLSIEDILGKKPQLAD